MRLLCRLSSVRLWLTVVLISAGFVCAIWAETRDPWGRTPGQGAGECYKWFDGCMDQCKIMYGTTASKGGDACSDGCTRGFLKCYDTPNPSTVPVGTVGQTPPPNAVGPNSTPTPAPTPRRPIKGPPHKLGPNPTPSPTPWTGFPKPTPPPIGSPTPTPSATPRKHPIKRPPRRLGPSPTPSPNPILLAKPAKPTPSPKPTPKKSSHSHH
jgi:hypothetical protein